MKTSWLRTDQLEAEIDHDLLADLPMNHSPVFLRASLDYLLDNSHIVSRTKYKGTRSEAGYLRAVVKGDVHYLPLIKITSATEAAFISPSAGPETASIHKKTAKALSAGLFREIFLDTGAHITLTTGLFGFDLTMSLFGTFAGFETSERTLMTKKIRDISLHPVEYERGQDLLIEYQKRSLERKEGVYPVMLRRNSGLFKKHYCSGFELLLVKNGKDDIGIISHIKHKKDLAPVEICGDHMFHLEQVFPVVIFNYLIYAKLNRVTNIYMNLIDWCNMPFVREVIMKEGSDVSGLVKVSRHWQARNIVGPAI